MRRNATGKCSARIAGHFGDLFTLATLIAAGCGPEAADKIPSTAAERYAKAICDTYERCDCLGETLVNEAECLEVGVATFEAVESWPGVRFDEKCFEEVLKYIEKASCETTTSQTWTRIPCLVFEGTRAIGEECSLPSQLPANDYGGVGGLVDDGVCKEGGVCVEGRCQSTGAVAQLGEACMLESGAYCDPLAAERYYCATDGRCREQVAEGEACDTPYACNTTDLYCKGLTDVGGTGTCAPRVPEGGTCDAAEISSCEVISETYCTAEGVCGGPWPTVCGFLTLPADALIVTEWIPVQ